MRTRVACFLCGWLALALAWAADPPTVTTSAVSGILADSAQCGGEVVSAGASAVTARGVCWNTAGAPTTADATSIDGSGLGSFASSLTGLTPGQTYYVCAYATNAEGTAYGEPQSFTALPLFSDLGVSLPGVSHCSAAWGDYDNDGKLDILLAGYCSDLDADITRVYRNHGDGTFTDSSAGLPGLQDCSVAWGDYDNDGKLDILIAGYSSDLGEDITRVYRNHGDGTFTDSSAGLPGVDSCSVAWGDYDNDGKLDILLAGSAGSGYITRVYRNNGDGTFTDLSAGLPGVARCSVAWGDYDNDGWLDILLAGDCADLEAYITRVYRNHGDGTFTDLSASLPGVARCSVAWGDTDNDGKLDILLAGNSDGGDLTRVYRNQGDGTFTDLSAGLPGVARCSVAWGDYDNDGWLDILLAGDCADLEAYTTRVYRNNGDGTFADLNAGLPGVMDCGVAWGDYDNAGTLDILLAGAAASGDITRIYRNGGSTANTPPAAPTGLTVTAATGTFAWAAASDAETPAAGLSYNLRVGTASGAADIFPGMADSASGWRRVPALGNTNQNTTWTLGGLVSGPTYYWSVQAVDSTLAGGAWAAEGTFTSPLPGVTTAGISGITITTAQGGGEATAAGDSAITAKGLVWSTSAIPSVTTYLGRTDHGGDLGSFSDTIAGLSPGQTYYVRAYATNSSGTSYGQTLSFTTLPLFSDLGANLPGLKYCSVAWGDYDNDGKLDILLAGWSSDLNQDTARVYRNDGGGTFTDTTAGLPGVDDCSVAWGDYDNDGKLDILLAGWCDDLNQDIARVYRNDGDGTFTDISAGLPGVDSCSVAWGDYDNDGNLDVLLAGYCNDLGEAITRVFRNNGDGTFTDTTAGLPGVDYCSVAWGDYDNDGRLDILLAGYTNSDYISRVYRNHGDGTFTDSLAGLPGVDDCSVAWGDYDNDGNLDVLLAGYCNDLGADIARVYRNHGDGTFTDLGLGLPGVEYCSVAWGDGDNDGKLDILLAGYTDSGYISRIYRNHGDGTFTDSGAGLPGIAYGSVAWGDCDNDGKLDILIAGSADSGDITRIYRNGGSTANTAPAAPPGLTVTAATGTFAWAAASDTETPPAGLTYNLRVGTASGAADIFPGMADSASGWRRVPALGNVNGNTTWTLGGLVSGPTYYWSVQAVDSALAGGAWATEGMFTSPLPVVTTADISSITSTTAQGGGEATAAGDSAITAKGLVWSTSAIPTVTTYLGRTDHGSGLGSFSDPMTGLSPGRTHYVRAYATNGSGTSYGQTRSFTALPLFPSIAAGLPGLSNCSVAWGDYDNDGNLDILLAGYCNDLGADIARVYRNHGDGTFTDIGAGLPGVDYCSVAWGDYDNDGKLDILLAGDSGEGKDICRVYRNHGDGTFTDSGAGLPGIAYGSVAWGDYDNDGKLDILIAGWSSSLNQSTSRVYRNHGDGTFADIGAGLPAVSYCSVAWGDYDNDGNLDILIAGWCDDLSESICRVYRNHGDGTFTDSAAGLPGVEYCSVAWGDYDNDGRLDILLAGASYEDIARVYQNHGDGTFTDSAAGLPGVSNCSVAWGDYDNDGRLDILIAGDGTASVYRNHGDGTFPDIAAALTGVDYCSAAWGDYDSDGKLDILIAGSGTTSVYRNAGVSAAAAPGANTVPAAPTGLTASAVTATGATLGWNAASDAETPAAGLSYNLRVGTAPGAADIFPGMADSATGWRRVPALGNVNQNTTWTLGGLVNGQTYYWSVQAVDAAWAGGAWAAEGTFASPLPVVTTFAISSITTTSAQGGGEATAAGDSAITAKGLVWGASSGPTVTTYLDRTDHGGGLGSFSDTMTSLSSGQTYYVRAYATNTAGTAYGEERSFTTIMIPPGNAVALDGSDDYVSIPDHDPFDFTTNYTLEAWINADSLAALGGIVTKYHTSGANGWLLRLSSAEPYDGLCFDQMETASGLLQPHRWYHVAAVNENGTRHLWLNGVEQPLEGTPITVQANSDVVAIGVDFLDSPRYFAGRIDEVRIWNVARTEAEIRDAMHRQLAGNESGLVAYYPFNQNAGTTVPDLTANHHDGTLMNGATWTSSTFPCADAIADSANLRGAWDAQTNSLPSSRFSVADASVTAPDFAVFGHDGGTDDWQTPDCPATVNKRLTRVWQAEVSGTVSADVLVDTTGLADLGDGSTLRLLVDPDGTFADATVVAGTFSAPTFTVAGQSLVEGAYYTLGFVGEPPVVATVTTAAISGITSATASGGGEVVSAGDSAVTARGVCWNTTGTPTTADSHTTDDSGLGTFTSALTGLSPDTTHYVRAYATNSDGTAYGAEVTFRTLAATPLAPTVGSPAATTLDVAIGSGDGNPAGTEYALQVSPAVGGNSWVQADGSVGAAVVLQTAAMWGTTTVSGLQSGATYTFKARARNGAAVETALGPGADGTTLSVLSATPGVPDLLPGSDSGASDTDNLTNRNNSSSATRLQFEVGGTVSGATVRLYAGSTPLGSALAAGTSTTVTTDGTTTLADGAHNLTVRQTVPLLLESAASAELAVTIDTSAPAVAAANAADPCFGTNGAVLVDSSAAGRDDWARAVVVQADGKRVTVGRAEDGAAGGAFGVSRFLADGTADVSFGSGGTALTAVGPSDAEAFAVLLQADGMIVAAGRSRNLAGNDDLTLVRYTATGSLDGGFGTGGIVTTDLSGGTDVAYGLVLQWWDNRIVAVGVRHNGADFDMAATRYNPDGTVDTTYGTAGTAVIALNAGVDDLAFGAAIQTDGKVVLAGRTVVAGRQVLAVVRLDTTGALDSGFGTGGAATLAAGTGDAGAFAVAVQADGRVLVAGNADNGGTGLDLAAARWSAAGVPDASFGSGGVVVLDVTGTDDWAFALALQPDGRIVLAGSTMSVGREATLLTRLRSDGSLDPGFGHVLPAAGSASGDAAAYGVALAPGDKVVAAGKAYNGTDYDTALVQLQGAAWEVRCTHGAGVGEIGTAVADGYVESRTVGLTCVAVRLGEAVDPASVSAGSLLISDTGNPLLTYAATGATLESDGRTLVFTFAALPNARRYTFELAATVTDAAGCSLSVAPSLAIAALAGDANGDGSVDVADLAALREHSTLLVVPATARYDLNADGRINVGDLLAARARIGGGGL